MANLAKGRAYEVQVRDYLLLRDGYTEAYLWEQCPETILREAGIIESWQEHRLMRRKIAALEAEPGFKNPLRDTGIDIMARMPDGNLDAVQCKAYGPNTSIRMEDLAGYAINLLGMFIHSPHTRGSLFYDGKLSCVIEEQFRRRSTATRTRLVNLKYQKPTPAETDVPDGAIRLYADQEKALATFKDWWLNIDAPERVHLDAPCGFGKTIIGAAALSWLGKNAYATGAAFVVPLIEHAQHIYDRLLPFVQEGWEPVLVDSEGERDIARLRPLFEPGRRPPLIVSTYKSADVLRQLPWGNGRWLVILDEFHNLSRADLGIGEESDLHKLLTMAPRVLGMSATPRIFELEGSDDDEDGWMGPAIYKMSWADAIQKKIISDYRIYVPSISEPDGFLREEAAELRISDIALPLYARCEFLLKGMLEQGLHRCIVFMPSGPGMIAEATAIEYTKMLQNTAEWLGIEVGIGVILGSTGRRARREQIADFENGPIQTAEGRRPILRILLSVRILDECVDLPTCDSVFFASPCRSKVRGLQRAARCMRFVDGKMPGIFVWCDEMCSELAELFAAIKEQDPAFPTKIRILSKSYDRREETAISSAAIDDKWLVDSYVVGVKTYLSLEERALARARELVAFVEKHGRMPRQDGKDLVEGEGPLGSWLNDRRAACNGKGTYKMYPSVKAYLDNHLPGWSDDREEQAMQRANELVAFVKKHGRMPREGGKDLVEGEGPLGIWLRNRRYARKGTGKGKLYPSVMQYLDNHLPGWSDDREEQAMHSARELVAFVEKHGRMPRMRGKDLVEGEGPVGRWLSDRRCARKGTGKHILYPTVKKYLDDNLPGW